MYLGYITLQGLPIESSILNAGLLRRSTKKIRMFPWNTKSDISSSIPRQSLPMQRNMHIVVERKGQGGKLFLISAKNQRCLYFHHWNSIKGFQHFEKFWLLRKEDIQNRLKFFGTIFFICTRIQFFTIWYGQHSTFVRRNFFRFYFRLSIIQGWR